MKSRGLIFVLLVVLLVVSGYLAGSTLSGKQVCLIGDEDSVSDCLSVQNSKYGRVLGIRLVYLGFIGTLILLILYSLSSKDKYKENYYELYLLFVGIGAVVSLSLLYIQFFVLKQICSSCLVADSLMILIAILSFIEFSHRRR